MKKNKTELIITDAHIDEKSIADLENIFTEICKYKADVLVFCGDYFEKKKPTPREIIFGTKWAYKFKQLFKKVILLKGNHDKTEDISAVDYLKYFGITVVDDYTDECKNYFGHFMVKGSKLEYGTAKCSLTDLKTKKRIILGHQHSFQKLAKNAFHLGSVRYVNFNESQDKHKFIAKIDSKNEIHFIPLTSPMPMYDVNSIEELSKIKPGMVMVRLIISSFEQFKNEVNAIAKERHKYNTFKLKLNFVKKTKVNMQSSLVKTKLKDILKAGIEKIKDKDVKQLLEEIIND